VKRALPIASVIPGAGVAARVASALPKVKRPPPRKRPPPIPQKPILTLSRRKPKAPGVFSDVTAGSSTTAKKPAKKKRNVIKAQVQAAGIRFKKRAKKNGGLETVAVNSDGAVISDKPIPDSIVEKAGATIDEGVLPADAVQSAAPPIPSAKSVQQEQAQLVPQSGGGSGGGYADPESGSGVAAQTSAASGAGNLLENPLLLAAGAGVALIAILGRASR
jgi:hypothetical protein